LLNAISESVRKVDEGANHQAFRLGRFLVMNPNRLKPEHETQTWNEVMKEKEKYLSKRNAPRYRKLVEESVRWMDIPAESKALLARTIYDLIRYEGARLAERYIELVWRTYRRDRKEFGLKATTTVILELFRAIAIKDEVWVAQLLTSPEKYERDSQRFHIDPKRGDKISYVHFNRPQFVIAGRSFEFDLKTRDWMLNLMKHAKFLRWMLPTWHKREKDYRDWYVQRVLEFTYFESAQDYELYAAALATASQVKGYREIRHAKMDEAIQKAQDLLNQVGGSKTERRLQSAFKPQ
jgi:indolepyruvate ferredoxin oxidoreductase